MRTFWQHTAIVKVSIYFGRRLMHVTSSHKQQTSFFYLLLSSSTFDKKMVLFQQTVRSLSQGILPCVVHSLTGRTHFIRKWKTCESKEIWTFTLRYWLASLPVELTRQLGLETRKIHFMFQVNETFLTSIVKLMVNAKVFWLNFKVILFQILNWKRAHAFLIIAGPLISFFIEKYGRGAHVITEFAGERRHPSLEEKRDTQVKKERN